VSRLVEPCASEAQQCRADQSEARMNDLNQLVTREWPLIDVAGGRRLRNLRICTIFQ
jgi:hypothetical protein